MASSSDDSGIYLRPFFDRCNLPITVKDDCDAFAKSYYSGAIRAAPFQGYCSYTLFVGEETAVQFRPSAHKLDIDITNAASDIFKSLAPETEYLGQLAGTDLHAFSMRKLTGISLADYRKMSCNTSAREELVRNFAKGQILAIRNGRRA